MEHIYVGIDWADDHHDVYITNDSAKPLANILRTDLYLHKPLPKESLDAGLKQLTRAHKSLVQQRVKLVNQLIVQLKSY